MIELDEIGAGDYVGIRDLDGNVARGTVAVGKDKHLAVAAFGLLIPFCRTNGNNRRVPVGPAVKVIEHTPLLVAS